METRAEQWGKLIKFKRQQKRLKQDDVAIGICTPSYLSRIENGVVIAEHALYEQLFKRLGINLAETMQNEEQALQRVEMLYEKLLTNEALVHKEIEQLENYEKTFQLLEHQLFAKLVYSRYLLSINKDQTARTLLNEIEPFITYKGDRLTTLYIAITAFAHLSFLEFQQLADREDTLFYAQLMLRASNFEQANYHYHLAFAYHRTYQFQKALRHIEIASTHMSHMFKPLFQLKLYSMKGVIFNDLNRFHDALREYEAGLNLLENVTAIQTPMQFSSIHNNIAYCYECQKDFDQACKHYQLAQYYEHDLHSVINWMRSSFQKQDFKQLDQLFNKYGAAQFSVPHHKYQRALLAYAREEQQTISDLKQLEELAFPHFEQQQYFALTLFYAPLWAQFYEKLHAYKHASHCYQLALQASEKIRERMSS